MIWCDRTGSYSAVSLLALRYLAIDDHFFLQKCLFPFYTSFVTFSMINLSYITNGLLDVWLLISFRGIINDLFANKNYITE